MRVRSQILYFIEAALIGTFFVQALRFLVGVFYSRVSGAYTAAVSDPAVLDAALPGMLDPSVVSSEITFLIYMIFLPLLALILGRFRALIVVAAILVAVGRALMVANTNISPAVAAALTVGGGLLYIAMLIRHRVHVVPYLFLLGLGSDQILRALGNTLDPTWSGNTVLLNLSVSPESSLIVQYLYIQIALSVLVVILSIFSATQNANARGLLSFWGGIGLGAMLFLELALLATPNALTSRATVDYTTFVPLVIVATLLPIIPWIRTRARAFIALFDGSVRGWSWMLMIALLVVFGTRFPGIGGGIALVLAQFGISLSWWWLVRPQAEKERNFTGVWMILSVAIFALLATGDFFTYEYAFVRDFVGNFTFLNEVVPPLLRGFRGMGLGILLMGVFLAILPITQTPRRIPWGEQKARALQSFGALLVVVAFGLAGAFAARPPLIQGVRGVDSVRVGTYNIHAGFNEFFHYDLEAIAQTIEQSGADVVLLQEVEAGRLTSFGVDQSLWLARRLGMDRRFYGTNENMQGLAVLARVPIVYHQGRMLTSVGSQTGVQHVQVSTDGGISAVAFYNTWLGLLWNTSAIAEQEQDQQRQLTEIFTAITQDYTDLSQVRLVLGGTFNNVPGSPLIEQLRVTGFTDPFAGLPPELSTTLWRTNARARFDYLWTRNVLPLGAGVLSTSASDHRMAAVEILINRRPG